MGDIPTNPTALCGSNVVLFGHPAGWLGLGKREKLSPKESQSFECLKEGLVLPLEWEL